METRSSDFPVPNRVILATDFSPASSAAEWVACRVAQGLNAPVTILHIFQYVPHHRYKVPVEWMVEIIRRDVRGKLKEAKGMFREANVEAEVMVIEDGAPSQQIVNFVRSFESPVLVMGTHATGGMERFLIGSTAEEVLRLAGCPVITVGPHVTSAMKSDPRLSKLLYATDFSEASLGAVPLVAALKQSLGADLQVLHISTESSFEAKDEDPQFDRIRKSFGDQGSAEFVTLHGKDICQAIVNEAERYPADLLILGVHRASAFAAHLAPKIAFQTIAAAPCAVLTISS